MKDDCTEDIHNPIEINKPDHVEIMIRDDGKTVWVNVDGECIFRASQVKNVRINDKRNKPKRMPDKALRGMRGIETL